MTRLRTTLTVLAVGGATRTTGVVAVNAVAIPARISAVEAAKPAASTADATSAAPARAAKGWWKGLTDTQQACLKDEVGTRPVGPPSDTERAVLRARVTKAADACDVTLPFVRARALWDGLTDAQRQCLRDADVQRPWGPLDRADRQEVRAALAIAAKACGVTEPARPSPRP